LGVSEVVIHHERRGRVAINGAAVRAARKARGWKPSRLAAELDISEKTLSRYESGATEPRWQEVATLAVLLELSPFDLFVCGGSGPTG
jgi:ribosome-binding protein aMBF1 (putative translation factor)